MKIAIYSGHIPATTFIERLIEGLAAEGVEVWLFGEISGSAAYDSSNVHVCGWRGRWGRKLFLLRFLIQFLLIRPKELFKLWHVVQESDLKHKLYLLSKFLPVVWYKPDIFHLQWVRSVEEWHWVQQFDIRLVVSLRGSQVNYVPIVDSSVAALYQRCFPHVEGFHAVSNTIARKAQGYGAPSTRIRVVYSGLDEAQLSCTFKKSCRQTLHVISIGRAHWIKGYTYAIDACQLLADKIDFHYTIVGGFCEEHAYHVRNVGLESRIELIGALPFEEVQHRIREADVLLLPSVEEGIANVVLEAMALGVPVISTDCGGMSEVIEDGVNGFLVPVRSPQAIADAILRFSRLTVEERLDMVANARKTIEKQHSLDRMVKGMLEFYGHVLRDKVEGKKASPSLLPSVSDFSSVSSR